MLIIMEPLKIVKFSNVLSILKTLGDLKTVKKVMLLSIVNHIWDHVKAAQVCGLVKIS